MHNSKTNYLKLFILICNAQVLKQTCYFKLFNSCKGYNSQVSFHPYYV